MSDLVEQWERWGRLTGSESIWRQGRYRRTRRHPFWRLGVWLGRNWGHDWCDRAPVTGWAGRGYRYKWAGRNAG